MVGTRDTSALFPQSPAGNKKAELPSGGKGSLLEPQTYLNSKDYESSWKQRDPSIALQAYDGTVEVRFDNLHIQH